MYEPRLYLYRKAGREVWDAEMWLSDGRRRVWRTGIVDRAGAEEAARARLEALVGDQDVAASAASCSENAHEPDGLKLAFVPDAAPPPVPVEMTGSADIPAPAGVVTQAVEPAANASSGVDMVSASEGRGQALQTQTKAQKMGALSRFDRWFFADLAALWRKPA